MSGRRSWNLFPLFTSIRNIHGDSEDEEEEEEEEDEEGRTLKMYESEDSGDESLLHHVSETANAETPTSSDLLVPDERKRNCSLNESESDEGECDTDCNLSENNLKNILEICKDNEEEEVVSSGATRDIFSCEVGESIPTNEVAAGVEDEGDHASVVVEDFQQIVNKVDEQIQCDLEIIREPALEVEVSSVAVQCEPERVSRGVQKNTTTKSVYVQCELQNYASCGTQCTIIGSPLKTKVINQLDVIVDVHQPNLSNGTINLDNDDDDDDDDENPSEQRKKLPETVEDSSAVPPTIQGNQDVCKNFNPRRQMPTQKKFSARKDHSPAKSDYLLVRKVKKTSPARRALGLLKHSQEHFSKNSPTSVSKHNERPKRKRFLESLDEILPVGTSSVIHREKPPSAKGLCKKANDANASIKSYFTGVPQLDRGKNSDHKNSSRREHRGDRNLLQNPFALRDCIPVDDLSQPIVQEWISSVVCERHSSPESIADVTDENDHCQKDSNKGKMCPRTVKELMCSTRTAGDLLNNRKKASNHARSEASVDDNVNRQTRTRQWSCSIASAATTTEDDDDDDVFQQRRKQEGRKTVSKRPCRVEVFGESDDNKSLVSSRASKKKKDSRQNEVGGRVMKRVRKRRSSHVSGKHRLLGESEDADVSDSMLSPHTKNKMVYLSRARKADKERDDIRGQPLPRRNNGLEDKRKNKDCADLRREEEPGPSTTAVKRSGSGPPKRGEDERNKDKVVSKEKRILPKRKKRKLFSPTDEFISESSEEIVPETLPVSPQKSPPSVDSSSAGHNNNLNTLNADCVAFIKTNGSPVPSVSQEKNTRRIEGNEQSGSKSTLSSLEEEDNDEGGGERKNVHVRRRRAHNSDDSTDEEIAHTSDNRLRKRKPPTLWSSESDSDGKIKKSYKKAPYTQSEKRAIIDYIVAKKLYSQVGGINMWRMMEKARVCKGRTWQSLKEHFRKQIFPRIESYSLPRDVLAHFLAIRR